MNASNGLFYETKPGESFEQMAARFGFPAKDVVPVARMPDTTCKKCNGKGLIKRGFFSKRFKPCECVL